MKSNQSQIVKLAIQQSLIKNLPLIVEDAVHYIENHHLQLKRNRRKTPIIKKITLEQEATLPFADDSGERNAPYDCPPESWEDIGIWEYSDAEEEKAPEKEAEVSTEIQLEDSSNFPPNSQCFTESLYDELD